MQSDINYPKSKAFNIFLRYLQYGISLACTVLIAEVFQKTCIGDQFRIVQIGIGSIILISLIAIITIRCSSTHPKIGFFILLLLSLGTIFTIGFFSFKNLSNNFCALSFVFYWYYIILSILYVFTSFLIFTLPFLWIQRYTNSPGNLAWLALFALVVKQWKGSSNLLLMLLIIIPLLTVVISSITFISNIFVGCKGVTTCMKSVLKFGWYFNIILMLASEGLAIYAYILGRNQRYFLQGFSGNLVKILLTTFIFVNLIDLIFWIFGYRSLHYENGDSIRDDLIKFGKNPQFDDSSDVNEYTMPKEGQYGQIS